MRNNHVPLGYGIALVMCILPDSRDLPSLHGFLTYSSAFGSGCCPSSFAAYRIMARLVGASFARLGYSPTDSMTQLRVRRLNARISDRERAALTCASLYDACTTADFLPLLSFSMEGARAVPCLLALYRGLPYEEVLSELEDDVVGIHLDDAMVAMTDLTLGCANPGAMAFAEALRQEFRKLVEPWARMDLLRAACALRLFEDESKPPRAAFPTALLPLLAGSCDVLRLQNERRQAMLALTALADAPAVSVVEGHAITGRLLRDIQKELGIVLPLTEWSLAYWSKWYDRDGVFRRK
jgi:hypothetical protein